MPAILCFGDSNTWGYDPVASATSPVPMRHPRKLRWTGVMAAQLGAGCEVIAEGQNGRTTVFDEGAALVGRKGRDYLPVALDSHKPLDLVVFMLGTNDLKTIFNATPQDIAQGVSLLVKMILQSESGPQGQAPQILLVCPPAVGEMAHLPDLAARFVQGAARSREIPRLYAAVAEQWKVHFLNAQEIVTPSPLDALHLDEASHRVLGEAIAQKIVAIMVPS